MNLNGLPARLRLHGSRGRWRWRCVWPATRGAARRGSREPVLILDDVFAELDQQRRSRLAHFAAQAPGQVMIHRGRVG